jgi:hypothetical protein
MKDAIEIKKENVPAIYILRVNIYFAVCPNRLIRRPESNLPRA